MNPRSACTSLWLSKYSDGRYKTCVGKRSTIGSDVPIKWNQKKPCNPRLLYEIAGLENAMRKLATNDLSWCLLRPYILFQMGWKHTLLLIQVKVLIYHSLSFLHSVWLSMLRFCLLFQLTVGWNGKEHLQIINLLYRVIRIKRTLC